MRKKKEIFEVFNSVQDFYDAISTREINAQFERKYGKEGWKEKVASTTGSVSFTDTANFAVAENLAKKGYAKGAENLAKVDAGNFSGQTQKRRAVQADVVGFAPIVPNALLGVPKAMLNSTLQPRKIPVVSLYYEISANCSVSAEKMQETARKVLAAITAIERKNIRVELNVCNVQKTSNGTGQRMTCVIKLKDYRQPLDLLKIAYPLTHPSFFRRHMFRWMETVPELDTTFTDITTGYGYSETDEKEAYEKNLKGHVPENSVFLSFYKARSLSAQEIADLISSRQR